MAKTLLYRLFGFGSIPARLRPVLEREGVIVADEGMGGWFVTRDVRGPRKRYIRRTEGFSGCLVVTRKRVLCYTYRKRQVNIAADDPRLSELRVLAPDEKTLSIAFESGRFRKGWSGDIGLVFETERAGEFERVLRALGARCPGRPDTPERQQGGDAVSPRRGRAT
jgi:hypothetical protein